MEEVLSWKKRVYSKAKHSDRAKLIRSQDILGYSLLVHKIEEQGQTIHEGSSIPGVSSINLYHLILKTVLWFSTYSYLSDKEIEIHRKLSNEPMITQSNIADPEIYHYFYYIL